MPSYDRIGEEPHSGVPLPARRYSERITYAIAGFLCVMGLILFMGQGIAHWAYQGTGFWAGTSCIITGLAGFYAGWFKTKGPIIILLLMSIICVVLLIIMLATLASTSKGFIALLIVLAILANTGNLTITSAILCACPNCGELAADAEDNERLIPPTFQDVKKVTQSD